MKFPSNLSSWILAGLLVCLFPAASYAQPLFAGTISPNPAGHFESATLTVAVPGCSVSGPKHTGIERSTDGTVLSLTFDLPAAFGCFLVGDFPTELPVEVPYGSLFPGTYTIEHYRRDIDGPQAGVKKLVETLPFVVTDSVCRYGQQPGATLAIPYFEVDLKNPEGKTTTVSINNADDEAVLARVAIWTDLGREALGFDLYLEANDVQTFNLRQILEDGLLPTTGQGLNPASFQGCSAPLELPTLDPAALARLRAVLSGRADPGDGLCYSSSRDDDIAVGSITVDTVRGCSDSIQFPGQDGYFEEDGSGLAVDRNVLWGDYFYIDPANNSAQGYKAVTLPAVEGKRFSSFYGQIKDRRNPLPVKYQARYFNAGDFAGGSEYSIWFPFFRPGAPGLTCGDTETSLLQLLARELGEDGGDFSEPLAFPIPAFTFKIAASDLVLDPAQPFGLLQFQFLRFQISPGILRTQGFVTPILRAEDRFSVGLEALELESFCDPGSLVQ